jgi:hypothetical protein
MDGQPPLEIGFVGVAISKNSQIWRKEKYDFF